MKQTYPIQAPNKSVENTDYRYNQPESYGLGGVSAQCAIPQPLKLPLPEAMERTTKTVCELEAIINTLTQRLSPVISQPECCPPDCSNDNLKESTYTLVNHINTLNNRVYIQVQNLQNLLNRLAI